MCGELAEERAKDSEEESAAERSRDTAESELSELGAIIMYSDSKLTN